MLQATSRLLAKQDKPELVTPVPRRTVDVKYGSPVSWPLPEVKIEGGAQQKPILMSPADFMSDCGNLVSKKVGYRPPSPATVCRHFDFVTEEQEDHNFALVKHPKSPRRLKTPVSGAFSKDLRYEGKSNWRSFKLKFNRFTEDCDWTKEECLDGLIWCLTGPALDYDTLISDSCATMTYSQVLKKLSDRFGEHELPETAQAAFSQATQNVGYMSLWMNGKAGSLPSVGRHLENCQRNMLPLMW